MLVPIAYDFIQILNRSFFAIHRFSKSNVYANSILRFEKYRIIICLTTTNNKLLHGNKLYCLALLTACKKI